METKTIRITHIVGQNIIVDQSKHPETIVRYTSESGLSDWSGNIVGSIDGTTSSPYYTTQIPNVQYAREIEIGNEVTSIGNQAFMNCTNLTSVTIPESVTNIGSYAFSRCSGLTNVTIPNSVTSIRYNAFLGCIGLTTVTIPDSIMEIKGSVFSGCNGLTSVTIGSGVTSIGNNVFSGCNQCTIFDFRKSTSIPTLSDVRAFNNTPSNKEIIVPDALYDTWKTATNWSSTTNNIVNCIVKASQSSLGTL